MEKVAVYVSFKDKSKKSIEYTLKNIANWCIMRNYDYVLYFDSIKCQNERNELNNLKDAIRKKKVRKVVIRSLIDISNNPFESAEFLRFLEKSNCQIESIDGLNLKLYKNVFKKRGEK